MKTLNLDSDFDLTRVCAHVSEISLRTGTERTFKGGYTHRDMGLVLEDLRVQ